MRFRLDRGSSGPRHWTHGPEQRVSHRVTLAMDFGDPRFNWDFVEIYLGKL